MRPYSVHSLGCNWGAGGGASLLTECPWCPTPFSQLPVFALANSLNSGIYLLVYFFEVHSPYFLHLNSLFGTHTPQPSRTNVWDTLGTRIPQIKLPPRLLLSLAMLAPGKVGFMSFPSFFSPHLAKVIAFCTVLIWFRKLTVNYYNQQIFHDRVYALFDIPVRRPQVKGRKPRICLKRKKERHR
jgi:hypothetical protein